MSVYELSGRGFESSCSQWKSNISKNVILYQKPIYEIPSDELALLIMIIQKKWSFSLSIYSVNVTKFAGNYSFGHIYWWNHYWKTSFFVKCGKKRRVEMDNFSHVNFIALTHHSPGRVALCTLFLSYKIKYYYSLLRYQSSDKLPS